MSAPEPPAAPAEGVVGLGPPRPKLPRWTRAHQVLLFVLLVLAWSAIAPHDYFTWCLEVIPVLIGLPIVWFTRKQFPLTPLAYTLLVIHACILMVGGHYTYAEVPAGFWVRELMGWSRNNYDRLGHLAQGFVPAIVAREVIIRKSPLRHGKWLTFLVICFCMALSSFYELIEWWTAAATGTAAEAFLGTQGDPWDTQWDMMLAMIGACLSLASLSRIHDRQLPAVTVGRLVVKRVRRSR